MKVEYWQGADGQWYWHLKWGNGQVAAHSEGYVSRRNVLRALDNLWLDAECGNLYDAVSDPIEVDR